MGPRLSREEIVAAAAATVLDHGLAGLTYRRVADRVGTSDRMVVYYLPSRTDLVGAALGQLSGQLREVLQAAFGDRRREADDLLRAAWPVLTTADADRVFRVFLEIIGLSPTTPPFDVVAADLLRAWVDWVADRVTGSTPAVRHRRALAIVARLDGLLVMRHTLGADAADEAVAALGIAVPRRPGRRVAR